MKRYELMCQYDSRKNFGGKAVVEECDKFITLLSYNTMVARIKKGRENKFNILEVYNTQSITTVRHIKEFAYQNGFGVYISKDLEGLKELNK